MKISLWPFGMVVYRIAIRNTAFQHHSSSWIKGNEPNHWPRTRGYFWPLEVWRCVSLCWIVIFDVINLECLLVGFEPFLFQIIFALFFSFKMSSIQLFLSLAMCCWSEKKSSQKQSQIVMKNIKNFNPHTHFKLWILPVWKKTASNEIEVVL